MERIDAFAHALTEPFYDELTTNDDFRGLSGSPAWLWDVERFKADMADLGLDSLVLTLALPPLWRGTDPREVRPLVELANDEIRRLADEHPDHFIPVGTIPFGEAAYRDEFDRCVQDLDMAGVQIFSNVDGRPIDRPEFEWWYAYADRHGVPLWLHPQHHDWYDWAAERMDHRLFGWPFDTTLALSRLVFSGLTQRYDFDLVTHHGGGMVPFYGDRIERFYETRLAYPRQLRRRAPGRRWRPERPVPGDVRRRHRARRLGRRPRVCPLVLRERPDRLRDRLPVRTRAGPREGRGRHRLRRGRRPHR